MIKLTKLTEPARLRQNWQQWTQALLARLKAGEKPTTTESSRYRHPDIKAVLVQETHGKCAYCESKLQHIHHGDVEHMYPKSLDVTKSFEWDNLTLACEVCNQNKSDRDPLIQQILDPYVDEPEEHLFFSGPLIFANGSVKGRATRAILDLHRAELIEMRKERIDKLVAIYDPILDPANPIVVRRALYADLLDKEVGPDKPYSAMAKCIMRDMESRLDPAILA